MGHTQTGGGPDVVPQAMVCQPPYNMLGLKIVLATDLFVRIKLCDEAQWKQWLNPHEEETWSTQFASYATLRNSSRNKCTVVYGPENQIFIPGLLLRIYENMVYYLSTMYFHFLNFESRGFAHIYSSAENFYFFVIIING